MSLYSSITKPLCPETRSMLLINLLKFLFLKCAELPLKPLLALTKNYFNVFSPKILGNSIKRKIATALGLI
jgi:hypothetical protein